MKTLNHSDVSVSLFVKACAVLFVAAASLLWPAASHAVIVAEYTFTGSSLSSSDSSPTSTASILSTNGITGVIEGAIGDPAPSWFFTAADTNGPGAAPDYIPVNSASDYFYFTVNPNATTLDYGSLTLDVSTKTNAVGPLYYFSLQTSLDSYATNVATYEIAGSASSVVFQTYAFDLSAFDSSPAVQQFRIVLRDNTGTATRGLVFDNITLNAVPEPSVNALIFGTLAVGGVAYFVRRRRTRVMA